MATIAAKLGACLTTETKTILCLANSRKMSGRCVAGKALVSGGFGDWIRPVSSRPDKELSEYDRHYDDASRPEPAILDVINIVFTRKDPHAYQPENYLIDDNIYWRFIRKATFSDALRALDVIQPSVWGMSADSSYHGMFDRVPVADAPSFHSSLRLIKVDDLCIRVRAESANFGNLKKKLRGYFTYSKYRYALGITDPIVSDDYLQKPEGMFDISSSLLCISLGEPYQGSAHQPYAYKLIAGVILPP